MHPLMTNAPLCSFEDWWHVPIYVSLGFSTTKDVSFIVNNLYCGFDYPFMGSSEGSWEEISPK